MRSPLRAVAGALALAQLTAGLQIDVNDTDGIKSAASTVAYGMVVYYQGNETGMIPGELGDPYYWWEAGAMFNSLINYWYYTGDTTYNQIVKQGLQFQIGPDDNYMVWDSLSKHASADTNQCCTATQPNQSRRKR